MKYETASHAVSGNGLGKPKDATGCDVVSSVHSCEKCVAKDAALNMDYQMGRQPGRTVGEGQTVCQLRSVFGAVSCL